MNEIQAGTATRVSGFKLGIAADANTGEDNVINSSLQTPELGPYASAIEVERAIEALFASGAAGNGLKNMDVLVTRKAVPPPAQGYQWLVTFSETIAGADLNTPVLVSTLISRGDEHTVMTSVNQHGTFKELQGHFQLKFKSTSDLSVPEATIPESMDNLGEKTASKIQPPNPVMLAYNATADQMVEALRRLPYVRDVEVTRSEHPHLLRGEMIKPSGHSWSVTFISYGDNHHQGSVPLLEVQPLTATDAVGNASEMLGNSLYVGAEVLLEGNGPSVAVEVSNNGQQFSDSYIEFEYHPLIVLGTLYPVSGPAVGGTRVVIHLAKHTFQHSNAFKFKQEDSNMLENGKLCTWGSIANSTNRSYLATVESATSISCFTPSHVSGNVSVSVSLNGKDFNIESALTFRYDADQRELDVFPLTGPIYGGTAVTVRGISLNGPTVATMDRVKCAFGREIVSAFRITSDEIRCRSPPVSAPRSVNFEISTNGGIDFTKDRAQFLYEEAAGCQRSSVSVCLQVAL